MSLAETASDRSLSHFHPATVEWFSSVFDNPTQAQSKAWKPISRGQSTLLLVPTGSGKTLAAFLHAIDRIMFASPSTQRVEETSRSTQQAAERSVRVLYISPLKALGVDVERNLKSPLAGNQLILSGIGNVYKSAVLFICRINPFQQVALISDQGIRLIVETAHNLMRKNLEGYPRRTRFEGHAEPQCVYNRRGQPCFECGTPIQMQRQGDASRSTYWCPNCQAALVSGSLH